MNGRRALLALLLVLLACGGLWMWSSGTPDGARPLSPSQGDDQAGAHEIEDVDEGESAAGRGRVLAPRTPAAEGAMAEPDGVELMVVNATDDEPVAGAHVRIFQLPNPLAGTPWEANEGVAAQWSDGPGETVLETHTDGDGVVVLEDVRGRAMFARIHADGFAPEVIGFDSFAITVDLWPERTRRLHVFDTADEPIPAAVASIHSNVVDPPQSKAVSDNAGLLTFAAGNGHEVVVRARGYDTVVIEDLDEWGDADVVMYQGATIDGVVVSPDDEPIADAVVAIDGVSIDIVTVARTGADGRFSFDGLRATWAQVTLSADAHGRSAGRVETRSGARNVRIVLPRSGVVLGRVLRADGSPAPQSEIRCSALSGTESARDDGQFALTDVPAGPLRIEARLPIDRFPNDEVLGTVGEMGVAELRLAPGDLLADVEIRMQPVPASYLRYVVHGADGEPFGGFGVTYDDALKRGFGSRGGTRGGARRVRLAVPAGTPVELTFTTSDHDDLADRFEATITTRDRPEGAPDVIVAPPASTDSIELTLTTVRTDGAAIAEGADVNWTVDRRIARRVIGLPPGTPPTAVTRIPRGESATVLAWADGCGTRELVVPLTDAPQQAFTCRLPPESIVSGHLVTRTGRPVTRAHVAVLVIEPDGTESLSVASYDQLLPGGEFVADQLAGGHGRITVWDSNRRIVAERTFKVPEGGRVELGDVGMGELPRARGTVTIGGRPVAGLGVLFMDGRRGLGGTSTASDGTFEFPVPDPPGASLHIRGADERTLVEYTLEDVLDASPVVLRADAAGSLELRLGDDSEDVREVEVRLPGGPRIATGQRWPWAPLRLRGIPAGRIEIAVTSKPTEGVRRVWRGTADVIAGETTEVSLTQDR